MKELEDQGTRVDGFSDNSLGYGFYAEGKNNHYVEVHIWGHEIYACLKKRTGYFRYDIRDTIIMEHRGSDVEDIKTKVLELLEFSKTLMRSYKVELMEDELKYLIKNCQDTSIVKKLKTYL